jgi:hypothetical protein
MNRNVAPLPPLNNDAPPPFDPDPELIAHLEGNRRSLRGYRRKAEELRESAPRLYPSTDGHLTTERGSSDHIGCPCARCEPPVGVPILPPNAYRTHLPLLPVDGVVDIDPATVRAIAMQVRELLEDIVQESPDHPCP